MISILVIIAIALTLERVPFCRFVPSFVTR